MKKIGLIINPVAGMGGSVGLKGTDHVVEEALRRGAVPGSEKRAETALRELLPYKDELLICTGAGHMGGELAQRGFAPETLGQHVAIQINDTHPSMVIPELIRLLTGGRGNRTVVAVAAAVWVLLVVYLSVVTVRNIETLRYVPYGLEDRWEHTIEYRWERDWEDRWDRDWDDHRKYDRSRTAPDRQPLDRCCPSDWSDRSEGGDETKLLN